MEASRTTNRHDPANFSPAPAKYAEDELKLIGYTVRMLPACAVKDLLSIGVCVRCILRLFNAEKCIYSCNSLSEKLLLSVLDKAVDMNGDVVDNGFGSHEYSGNEQSFQESAMEGEFCRICLGILQFAYCDDKGTLAKMDSAKDFAVMIANVVKQDCHEIESFSQEVSLPSVIMEREQAVCLYMKKYESEHWFQETFISGCKSTKDVLKLSLTDHLETLLGAKSKMSSFHIRLTYTQLDTSIKVLNHMNKDFNNKRRKTGGHEGLEFVHGSDHDLGCLDSSNTEVDELNNGHAVLNFQLEKVNQPCHLTLICYRTPNYVGGRYLKYSRNVSQTCWIIDDERMGEASVEEIIGSNVLSICKADNYKFHAAGREDIDVRMLGSGRPFLVEIQNARQILSEVFTKEIERKINSLDNKLVGVKNLKLLSAQGWALMRQGEAEKQKEYAALVWISRSLEDDDVKTISSLKDMRILQKTPIRVLHRRSPLNREKIIHWMKIERIYGSSQYFLLHLCTQAGTYIKEFVHGDLGRTHPSLGSLLGCRAEILQLDVTDVKMDCFSAE